MNQTLNNIEYSIVKQYKILFNFEQSLLGQKLWKSRNGKRANIFSVKTVCFFKILPPKLLKDEKIRTFLNTTAFCINKFAAGY